MTNQFTGLNTHLFDQLDRLSNNNLTAEQIEQEVSRTEAIVKVADKIISNGSLTLSACQLVAAHGDRFKHDLPMLAGPKDPFKNENFNGVKK